MLERRTQYELAGMKDEGIALSDLDRLGEVSLILLDVNDASSVVQEDQERAVEVHVDGGRLDRGLVQRLDHDPAHGEFLTDGTVGEDHALNRTRRV